MTPDPTEPDAGPPPVDRSRLKRAAEQIRHGQERANAGLETLQGRRRTSPVVDVTFAVAERDSAIFGGVMSGALAFRLFLFLLPLTLVLVVLLGFAISSDPSASQDLVDRFGLRGALAQGLVHVTNEGRANRLWAFVIGFFGMSWAALGCVRLIRVLHFVAWDQPLERLRSPHRAAGIFVLANVLILVVPLLAEWVHAVAGIFGSLVGILGVFAFYVVLWVALSALLPHGDAPWQFLVPGAVLIAVGTQCLQLATVYILGPQVQNKVSVYGAVGVAAVLLTWLFIIARLIVASAVLNAVLHERRTRRHQQRNVAPDPPVSRP